ncbi:MAG: MFS transporter [Candidatus Shapirobacteria bacterium]
MKIRSFTKLFYIFQFFTDFVFIYAVEKLFMLNRGLNLSQIGILLFLWSAMTLLLEVPSGAIADRWSRRKMLILSGISYSLCYFLWIFSHSFWLFLFGFLLRTIGSTFSSGTLQAYVYDFLKTKKAENHFEIIWGKGNALRTLGIGIAVALGGFISEISFTITVFLSALPVLTTAIIAFIWPEVEIAQSTQETKYWQFVKNSFKTIKESKVLLRLMIYLAIVLAWLASLEEFNDIYLNSLGFSRSIIGLIFALAAAGQALASSLAHKFKKHSWLIINLSVIITALIMFTAAIIKHPIMAIGILFLGVMMEFVSVIKESIVQKETKSYQRATVSSMSGLIMNLIPHQLAFGFIANYYSFQVGYGFFGIFVLLYFLITLFVPNNKNR